MNLKEEAFLQSIRNKIKKYNIQIQLKDLLDVYFAGQLTEVQYTNGKIEEVDIGIEYQLCKNSVLYFLENYAWIDFPGLGVIPFEPYYFQRKTLERIHKYQKIVVEKVRQCLTEDNFVMTDNGYISIKDVKTGDKIETIIDGNVVFVEVKDSFYSGKKEICRILTNSGLSVRCSLDHKLFTKRGWVKAEDLTLKDEIISAIRKGKFGNLELENDKVASLAGYCISEGKNKAKLIHKSKSKFDFAVLSKNKYLTNELMFLNERQMSILLNNLYDEDGWITYKKNKDFYKYELGLKSFCYKLIKQVEYILQTKYGIHCFIQEKFDKKTDKKFWNLKITQKKSIINFINKIGIKNKIDTKKIIELINGENSNDDFQNFEKIRKIVYEDNVLDVYDISTESSSFLTNGLLVHNCGMSTLFSLYCLWKGNFRESESIDVVSLKQLKAQAFVSKMDATLNRMPEFLKSQVEKNNSQVIEWKNGSQIVSESQSENAGRSDSLSLLILDEAAHYRSERMIRGIVAAAQPTLSKTGGVIIILSTPNGTSSSGSYYYEQVMHSKMNENKDTLLVSVDWWEIPDDFRIPGPKKGYNDKLQEYILKDYYDNPEVKREAKKFFDPIAEKKYKENPWLNKQFTDLQETTYKQEVLHNFIVSGSSVFNEEILENFKARTKDPISKNSLGKHKIEGLWIWKYPVPGHRYIVSCDVSTGTGDDYASIEIFDVDEYEQAAEFKGMMSTKMIGRILKIIAKYYNEGFIIIECNSIGEAVFNEVYYHDAEPYINVYKQKKSKNGITRMTGWETNIKSRKLITNEFIDWFTVDSLFDSLKVYSERIYLEMTTWIWDGTKPTHSGGCVSGETLITTKDGFKRIDEIKKGELVLTHKGNFKKVNKTFKFKDPNKKMLKVKSFGKKNIYITSNHMFWNEYNNNFEFINFNDIYNYKLYRPTSIYSDFVESDLEIIDLAKYCSYMHDEENIYWTNKFGKQKFSRFLKIDDVFLFFLGHVLANGTISKKGEIGLTVSSKEVGIFNFYKEYFENKFNLSLSIHKYKKECFRIVIRNIVLWNFLKDMGTSTNKKMLNEFTYIDPKKQMNILNGYFFGNGCFLTPENRSRKISYATVSKNIDFFISSVLYRNRIEFSLNEDKGRLRNGVICSKQYKGDVVTNKQVILDKFDHIFRNFKEKYSEYADSHKKLSNTRKQVEYLNDYLLGNFYSVEQIDWNDYYYDLEVEDDSSYIANGYAVHNSHDDSIIAFSLALYLRNEVTKAGEGYLIMDDGKLIAYEPSKDKIDEEEDNTFGILIDGEEEEKDIFKDRYNVSKEDYEWIIS
jgi:intein/homing endonuclease